MWNRGWTRLSLAALVKTVHLPIAFCHPVWHRWEKETYAAAYSAFSFVGGQSRFRRSLAPLFQAAPGRDGIRRQPREFIRPRQDQCPGPAPVFFLVPGRVRGLSHLHRQPALHRLPRANHPGHHHRGCERLVCAEAGHRGGDSRATMVAERARPDARPRRSGTDAPARFGTARLADTPARTRLGIGRSREPAEAVAGSRGARRPGAGRAARRNEKGRPGHQRPSAGTAAGLPSIAEPGGQSPRSSRTGEAPAANAG